MIVMFALTSDCSTSSLTRNCRKVGSAE
jgi:hypothetical protein